MLGFYSKYDRVWRRFVPSLAKISYNPLAKIAGDTIARVVGLPFSELKRLPPNHLRIRSGAGNRLFNGHIAFIQAGNEMWLKFLSRKYCTSNSDIVELGCGCGRIARPLKDPPWNPWFEGTYIGVDIDDEMIEYCRSNFPVERFKFILSPHKSTVYSSRNPNDETVTTHSNFFIADGESKDFIYSLSLYSHLLETEVTEYIEQSYRLLRSNGIMYMTFFCIEHVELGGRWSFRHRCGNALIESAQFPEAAVAYHEAFMVDLVKKCGFREVSVFPQAGQSELVALK
jgi:SAM-dependent methyltransferase